MTLYHIDTDMGVDDGLALLVASRIPGAQIVAVSTVFGNVPIQVATRNARLFQHLLLDQQPFDVFMGAERASDGFSPSAIEAFGADGFGLATSDFAQELAAIDRAPPARPIPEARRTPETRPVTLIGIGPATNLPKLASYYGKNNVARIILMSGCFFDVGNQDNAEFNAYCDPEALQSTLALGVPVAMVPLDVCRKVLLCRSVVNSYKSISQTKLMQLIVTSHLRYIDHCNRNEGIDGCFPYDALAVLAATDLHGFHRLRGRVHVDCSKARRGETTFSPDPSSHIEILTGGRLKWAREKLRSLQF